MPRSRYIDPPAQLSAAAPAAAVNGSGSGRGSGGKGLRRVLQEAMRYLVAGAIVAGVAAGVVKVNLLLCAHDSHGCQIV